MEQAVYELSTVRPHVPEGRHYGRAEWEPYCEGYYQALVMALRVMRLAFDRWKDRPMVDTPTPFPTRPPAPTVPTVYKPEPWDPLTRLVFGALIVAGSVFTLEVLVLMGLLIYRVLG